MALPTEGVISASMINEELGRDPNAPFDLNDPEVRGLAGKPSGAISFQDFYGKSNSILTLDYTMAVDPINGGTGFGRSRAYSFHEYTNYGSSNPNIQTEQFTFPLVAGGGSWTFEIVKFASTYNPNNASTNGFTIFVYFDHISGTEGKIFNSLTWKGKQQTKAAFDSISSSAPLMTFSYGTQFGTDVTTARQNAGFVAGQTGTCIFA